MFKKLKSKKILTIILDGFGLRNDVHGNAVKLAKMPNFVSLWNNYPASLVSRQHLSESSAVQPSRRLLYMADIFPR